MIADVWCILLNKRCKLSSTFARLLYQLATVSAFACFVARTMTNTYVRLRYQIATVRCTCHGSVAKYVREDTLQRTMNFTCQCSNMIVKTPCTHMMQAIIEHSDEIKRYSSNMLLSQIKGLKSRRRAMKAFCHAQFRRFDVVKGVKSGGKTPACITFSILGRVNSNANFLRTHFPAHDASNHHSWAWMLTLLVTSTHLLIHDLITNRLNANHLLTHDLITTRLNANVTSTHLLTLNKRHMLFTSINISAHDANNLKKNQYTVTVTVI